MKWKMRILFFCSYFLCAIGTTQMIPYLIKQGYEGMQKGIVLSAIAIATLFLQFFTGYLSDKIKKMKCIFIIVFSVYLISNAFLFRMNLDVFWYCVVMVGVAGGCYRTSQGLLDSWIIQLNSASFSGLRAFGAFGWAIGSWVLAIYIGKYDYDLIPFFLLTGGIVCLFISLWIPDSQRVKEKICFRDLRFILKNKQYIVFVIIVFLLYALGAADMYIVVDKILDISGSGWDVGMKWGLQSLMEIPILLLGNQLLKKFGVVSLMLFSSGMFFLRFVLYGVLQTPMFFLFASIMQLFTLPIVIFCSKYEFDRLVDEKWKTTGQMFAMSMYMGMSLFVMPLICSFLVEIVGYDVSLYMVSILALVAIVLLVIYKKMDMRKQKKENVIYYCIDKLKG